MAEHKPLPVPGYRPQSDAAVAQVRQFKILEERLLRILDEIRLAGGEFEVDQRWIQIGRTQLEQAFMAINRSIFKPERVSLEEEDAAQS